MPAVRYTSHDLHQDVARYMPVPKKMAQIDAWFKMARSVINVIPNPTTTDWFIKRQDATMDSIEFHLQNTNGQTGVVLIDRTKKGLGA